MCLRLGIDDPEQWLEDAPKRTVELWKAYYRLEPWGDERFMLAQLIHQVSKLVALKVGGNDCMQHLVQVIDVMSPDWVWQPEPKDEPAANPEATLQLMEKMSGISTCRPVSTPVQSLTLEVST